MYMCVILQVYILKCLLYKLLQNQYMHFWNLNVLPFNFHTYTSTGLIKQKVLVFICSSIWKCHKISTKNPNHSGTTLFPDVAIGIISCRNSSGRSFSTSTFNGSLSVINLCLKIKCFKYINLTCITHFKCIKTFVMPGSFHNHSLRFFYLNFDNICWSYGCTCLTKLKVWSDLHNDALNS